VAQDQDLCGLPLFLTPGRDSCSHEAARVIRRKTNRRHMIGDHHGRTAGGTTLLVRAVDGILGTHRLTAGQIEAAGPALSISTVSPDRWFPGDGAVVISRDGRALRGEVADVCVCTGQVVITLA